MVSSLFRKRLLKAMTPALRNALLTAPAGRASDDLLFPLFAEYVLNEHGREITRYSWQHGTLCMQPGQGAGARLF